MIVDLPPTHAFICHRCGHRWQGRWISDATVCPVCGNVTQITVRTIRRRDTNAA